MSVAAVAFKGKPPVSARPGRGGVRAGGTAARELATEPALKLSRAIVPPGSRDGGWISTASTARRQGNGSVVTRAHLLPRELGKTEKDLELGKRPSRRTPHRALGRGTRRASLVCVPGVAAIRRASVRPRPHGQSFCLHGRHQRLRDLRHLCPAVHEEQFPAAVTQWGHVFTGTVVTDLTPAAVSSRRRVLTVSGSALTQP